MYFPNVDPAQVLQKLPPWFGGQIGIAGSDTALGLRMRPQGVVIYVDPSHGAANDNSVGTDPNFPKSTIQAAVSSADLTDHSIIVLQPGNSFSESVVTADSVTGPNYVTIIGGGHGHYSVTWQSDAAASRRWTCVPWVGGWRTSASRDRRPARVSNCGTRTQELMTSLSVPSSRTATLTA